MSGRATVLGAAALLAAVPAGAASGGPLSGPTRASGLSMSYNPAALAGEPDGWAVMLEGGASLISVTFERAGADPNTGLAFNPVSFTTPGPEVGFTVGTPTPFSWLRILVGGFSPGVAGTKWPEDGPQRWYGTDTYFITYALTFAAVIQPTPRVGLAIGGGPYYGMLQLKQSIDFGSFVNGMLPPGASLFPLEDPQLEARSTVRAAGWSSVAVAGAWARPVDWLTIGAGVVAPRGIVMDGSLNIEASQELQESLPSVNLRPTGNIEIRYPMPWKLSLETEVALGAWRTAALFQYNRTSVQHVLLSTVTEAEPGFVEGRQVSAKNTEDDWLVGARVSRLVGEDWEAVLRVDFDPRYIPDETVHPINLDLTTLELRAGVRWKISESYSATLGYSFIIIFPLEVETSIFSPYAPSDSGLGLPPANGRYTGSAHTLTLSLAGIWASN